MEPHHKIQRLVSSFKNELASVLDECERSSSVCTPRPRFPRLGGSVDRHRGSGRGVSGQVLSKLDQVTSLMDEVSQELQPPQDGCRQASVIDNGPSTGTPEVDLDRDGQRLITLLGPPGSEPRQGLPKTGGVSETRFDKDKSLVYQRNSMKATLSSYYSPSKLGQIKPKDFPRETVEVFVTLPNKESGQRCTRARESAFLNSYRPTNGLNYSELSSDFEDESEEEQHRIESPPYMAAGTNAKSKRNKRNSLKSKPSHNVGSNHVVVSPAAESELSSSSLNYTPTDRSPAKKQTARMVARATRFALPLSDESAVEDDDATPPTSDVTPLNSSSPFSEATPTTPPPLISDDIDTQCTVPGSKESLEVDEQNQMSSSENLIPIEAIEHEVFTDPKSGSHISSSPEIEIFMDTEIELGESVQDDQIKTTSASEVILETLRKASSSDSHISDDTREDPSLNDVVGKGLVVKRTSSTDSSCSSKGSGIFTVYNDLKASLNTNNKDTSDSGKRVRRSGRLSRNMPVKSEVLSPLKRGPVLCLKKVSLETFKFVQTQKGHELKVEEVDNDAKQLHPSRGSLLPSSPLDDSQDVPASPPHNDQDVPDECKSLTWDEFGDEMIRLTEQDLKLSSSDEGDPVSVLAGSGVADQIENSVLDSVEEETPSVVTSSIAKPVTVTSLDDDGKETHIDGEQSSSVADSTSEEVDVQTIPVTNEHPTTRSTSSRRKSPKKEPSTPHHPPATLKSPKVFPKRKLFESYSESNEWSSESDFDMSNSQPPPSFRRTSTTETPSNKHQPATPFSSKKIKILSKISDDDDEKEEFNTPLRENKTKKRRYEVESRIKKEENVESDVEGGMEKVGERTMEEDSEGADERGEGTMEEDSEGADERGMKESTSSTSTEPTELTLSIPVNRPKVNETHVSPPATNMKQHTSKPPVEGEVSTRRKSQRLKNNLVDCVACGLHIAWEKTPVHMHERLEVIVCEKCLDTITRGQFVVEDGHEVYCTLCGDGGDLVLCDFCDKSFCQSCIARISGNDHLKNLLSIEDAEFTCYLCDPLPLERQKKLLQSLQSMLSHKGGLKRGPKKTFKSAEFVHDFDEDNGSTLTATAGNNSLIAEPAAAAVTTDPIVENAHQENDFNTSSPEQDTQSNHKEDKVLKSAESSRSPCSSSKGEGSISKRSLSLSISKKRKSSIQGAVSNNSHSDRSSGCSLSDDDSPEVDTDDVSISDSILHGDTTNKRKQMKKRRKKYRESKEDLVGGTLEVNSDISSVTDMEWKLKEEGDNETTAVGTSSKEKQQKKFLRSKLKLRVRQMFEGSDFECDSGSSMDNTSSTVQRKVRKRRLSSSSCHSSTNSVHRNSKVSRFAEALSSGSETELENGRHKLTVEMPDNPEDDFFSSATPDTKLSPVTYLTPRSKFRLRSSGSSDSDTVFSGRKTKRKPHARGISSTSTSQSRSKSRSHSSEKTVKTQRTRRRAPLVGSSDDDDFTDLSRVGPRPKKKTLNRSIFTDSDSMSGDKTKTKKKSTKSFSEDENSDLERSAGKNSTPGKKRKAIRKLISEDKLDERTRLAQQREKERLDRLKKKGASTSGAKEDQLMVLEEDAKTKEPKIVVRESIVPHLKPHQKEGIKFLYEACVESVDLFKSGQRNGAILAHCMGLGKTLQVIAFLDALLSTEEMDVHRIMILTPVNTLHNWMNEIEMWIPERDFGVYLMNVTGINARIKRLERWYRNGGIMFIGYDMFRNLAMAKTIRRQKTKEQLKKFLLNPGADIIVCDEGHVMRNSKSNLSLILNQVKTICRIVLTGTPLQNNLLEYYTMVNFVKPNLLGTLPEFTNRFVNPIKNGQCKDSQPLDIRVMKQRAHVLHALVSGCVQRKDYRVLADTLPPKQEYVISFRLSPVQDKLYRHFLSKDNGCHGAKDLFSTYSNLAKVWNHPWILRLSEIREMEKAERRALNNLSDSVTGDDSSLDGFIVFGSDEERSGRKQNRKRRRGSATSSARSSCQPSVNRSLHINDAVFIISSDSDSSVKLDPELFQPPVKKEKMDYVVQGGVAGPCGTENTAGPSGVGDMSVKKEKSNGYWYDSFLTEDIENKLEVSGKLLFLVEVLKEADSRKEKVIVFSQSLLTLNLIEDFLNKPEYGEWTPGLDYYRLDGSTRADVRQAHMSEFNDRSNDRIRLFLISTRAGSLGVNLVAANRVVIFDACWNPSHDLQAIFRTYRYGQTKPIFVYRLLAQGTMEEKIYDRQVTKESLSMRVVDEKQIGRHYTASDLAELFFYTPKPPTSPPYKRPEADPVLCSILDKLEPENICGYHEHDSLLEHIYGEELSEEERKAAWENYKMAKEAETRKYDFNAIQSKLNEDQKQLDALANTQTAAPSSLPGPSEPPTDYITFTNTVRIIEVASSYYQALISKQQSIIAMNRQIHSGQVPTSNGLLMMQNLNTEKELIQQKANKLLHDANLAIKTFNSSPLAQDRNVNKAVNQKRLQLERLFMSANVESRNVMSALTMPQQRAYATHPVPGPSHTVSQQQVSRSGQNHSSSSSRSQVTTAEVSSTTEQ